MKKTIYLIRHALPSFVFGERICLGRNTDLPLSYEGKGKAKLLAWKLEEEIKKAGVVYSSPMRRTRQTAFELAALAGVPVRVISGLTELDAGEWEGKTYSRIQEEYPELLKMREEDQSLVPPGGEEFCDCAARAEAAISTLAGTSPSGVLVMVSHASFNRSFLCTLTGVPFSRIQTIPQEYLAVNTVEYDTETGTFTAGMIGEQMV